MNIIALLLASVSAHAALALRAPSLSLSAPRAALPVVSAAAAPSASPSAAAAASLAAAPAASAAPAAPAASEAERLVQLNAAIKDMLAPFNTQLSKASVIVDKAKTNEQRAVELSATFDYSRTGEAGNASLEGRAEYSFPEAANAEPAVALKLSTEFDLLRVASQKDINRLAASLQSLIDGYARQQLRRYGSAAKVEARVAPITTDARGDVNAVGATLSADIDVSKVPPGSDPKSVLFSSLRAAAVFTRKTIALDVSLVVNPKSRYFEKDAEGLKEYVEKLLARDPRLMRELQGFIAQLDRFAQRVTAKLPESR